MSPERGVRPEGESRESKIERLRRTEERYQNLPQEIIEKAVAYSKTLSEGKKYLDLYINIRGKLSPDILDGIIQISVEEILNFSKEQNIKNIKNIVDTVVNAINELLKQGPKDFENNIRSALNNYLLNKGSQGTGTGGDAPRNLARGKEPTGQERRDDSIEASDRKGPKSEVIRKLTESAVKVGELQNRLYRVNYPHNIMRRIIFTDKPEEAENLLRRLRNGEYNVPATIFRKTGFAVLLHKLGIKVENRNPFESLALISEKGRDVKEQLEEIMKKILETESAVKALLEDQQIYEQTKKSKLEELSKGIDKFSDELKNLENAVQALENYFGGRKNIFSKAVPSLAMIGSSVALWGLAVGWFLPLWLIDYFYKNTSSLQK
jgi:hypothetical protein